MKITFLCICLSALLLFACDKKNPLSKKSVAKNNITNKNNKAINLALNFKEGANKEYKITTSINLSSIKMTGLAHNLEKWLLKFNNNSKINQLNLDMTLKHKMSVNKVYKDGSAEVEMATTEMTLEDLKINNNLTKMPVPQKFPMPDSAEPLKIRLSKKRKLLGLRGRKDIKKSLEIKDNLFKRLVDIVNSHEQLPKNPIRIGQPWKYNVRETISLNQWFPAESSGTGELNLDIKKINTLTNIRDNFYDFNHRFSGKITLTLRMESGEGSIIINLKGRGKSVLDNSMGLEHSVDMLTDFDFHLNFEPSKSYSSELGKPKIDVIGQVRFNSVPIIR